MIRKIQSFVQDDGGAVTVDWTVLSAAAVGMALSATAVVTDGINGLISRLDSELRSQQLSDSFVMFAASHFETLIAEGTINADQAETLFGVANGMMNQEIIDALEAGIALIEAGTITEAELNELVAIASVAYQRNVIDDDILEHYFGFDGSTPVYNSVL